MILSRYSGVRRIFPYRIVLCNTRYINGNNVRAEMKRKSNYRLGYHGKVVSPDTNNANVPLLWGGHIANDILWTPECSEEKKHVGNKQNNAKFEGTLLIAIFNIRVRQEIFVGYNLIHD